MLIIRKVIVMTEASMRPTTFAARPRALLPRTDVLRHEVAAFRIGIAVIALHVVDDNFLQPEPGIAAGDHLVSGLVPLAVLGIVTLSYPHLRAPLRATLSLFLGLLAVLAAGAEAGYYALQVGPSEDDYTGLLMIPAGLLLIAVGSLTLWSLRRSDGTRRRRYLRRLGYSLMVPLAGLLIIFPGIQAYIDTHAQNLTVPDADLGAPYEDVSFKTSDGLTLAGWYVPSRNGAAVIVYPGRKGTQSHARMLVRHGYGVLVFDRRGEGASEGDPSPWVGNRDLKAALAFLAARPDVEPERIGGLGLSVGGEMLLQTAAETDALKAVVSEGAGIRSYREFVELRDDTKWVTFPIMAAMSASMAILSNEAPPPDLTDLVGKIAPRPILLIHATNGQGGEELNATFYDAAGGPKSLWEITVGGHTGGIKALPDEYERRVVEFLDGALLDGQ